jgi:transposase, IS30 family
MPHGVEVRERVWLAVRPGVHLREAAESVGVSYDAARGWLADGGGVIPPPSRAGRPGSAYRRLTVEDRETIGLMLAAGHTVTEIADEVEVHKSTVSRERRRHANRNGTYRPLTAQSRAEATARTAHARPRKLSRPGPLRRYVVTRLKQKWSPQEISYRLRRDHPDDPV